MNPKIAIVGGFAIAVAAILYFSFFNSDKDKPNTLVDPKTGNTVSNIDPSQVTEITMLYSSEKKELIEYAQKEFAKKHPEIKVNLIKKGSLQSVDDILSGKEKPTVFSPADSLVINLLIADWDDLNHSTIIGEGSDGPVPLFITPLVFAIWEERAKVLQEDGKISWERIHTAAASDQGWPSIGGKAEWGFVKLGHTDPTRSNSGLQTLLLMTLNYYKKTSGLQVGDVLKPDYQKWIKDIEKGISKFETSTGTFMSQMILLGPSKYDIAVTYENLAISELEKAQGRWENLHVYYPNPTLWSDHPVTILQGDWVTAEQKKAAKIWIEYLRSRPIQERALVYGFRPADTSIPIKSADAKNPFTRLAQYGIKVEIPPVASPPEGHVIRNLLTMWSRVVKSR